MNFFKNKIVKLTFKILVSLSFLVYVIWKVDWYEVWSDVKEVAWWQAVIYVAILTLGMIISSYKWKLFSDYKKFKMSHFDHFKFYLAGTFINNFMPSFVGGDAYKAYQLGKTSSNRYMEAASSVMIDRITGLVGAMLLALFFSILNIRHIIQSNILIFINIIVILSFASDVVIAAMKKSVFWKKMARKFLPEKVFDLMREIYSYGNNKRILKKSVLWAVAFNFVGVAIVNYVLFLSLGTRIEILDYLSVIFLTSIVASVPISINNIGIKEWSYITFFGALGIPASPVITVAILSRVLQMIVSFFALPIYLKDKVIKSKIEKQ